MVENTSRLEKDDDITEKTLNMIMSLEGFEPKWAPDPILGWKRPTVMYGHTDYAGSPKYNETKNIIFTKSEGKKTLIDDLDRLKIKKLIKVPINKNQYGALLCLAYNIGRTNFSKSTLLLKLNNNDYVGCAQEFERWHFSGGKVTEGLCNRRDKEYELFNTPENAG